MQDSDGVITKIRFGSLLSLRADLSQFVKNWDPSSVYSTSPIPAMQPDRDSARGRHGRQTFYNVLHNHQHVLFHLLPDHNNCAYNLRPRRHELVLAIKGDARDFIERQLFKDTY